MEINKELSDIDNNKAISDVIKEINEDEDEDKENLNKKLHIFKVLDMSSEFEKMVKNHVFEKYEVPKIELSHDYDYDIGNEIACICLDANSSEVNRYDGINYIKCFNELKEICRKLNGFKEEYINENFNNYGKSVLETREGIGEKIIEILLSKELKAIFEHGRLQNQLSKKNNTTRKMKI